MLKLDAPSQNFNMFGVFQFFCMQEIGLNFSSDCIWLHISQCFLTAAYECYFCKISDFQWKFSWGLRAMSSHGLQVGGAGLLGRARRNARHIPRPHAHLQNQVHWCSQNHKGKVKMSHKNMNTIHIIYLYVAARFCSVS